LEVADAVIGVWGPERVGYRIAPYFTHYSMSDSNPVETFTRLAQELSHRKLAYLDLVEGVSGPRVPPPGTTLLTPLLRKEFKQTLFLANPDLPERFKKNAPLNAPDPSTYYGSGEKGYTDYPALA
jgi:N-ethylmaleimide reductase